MTSKILNTNVGPHVIHDNGLQSDDHIIILKEEGVHSVFNIEDDAPTEDLRLCDSNLFSLVDSNGFDLYVTE